MKAKRRLRKKAAIKRRIGFGRILAIVIAFTGTALLLTHIPRLLTVAKTEILRPVSFDSDSTWFSASLKPILESDSSTVNTATPDAQLIADFAPPKRHAEDRAQT
jgi:hypothetical protein